MQSCVVDSAAYNGRNSNVPKTDKTENPKIVKIRNPVFYSRLSKL